MVATPKIARLSVLLVLAAAGCVAGLPEHGPAPAPLPEIRSAAPAPGMVWVPGAWSWGGADWVWVPGRWESPPPTP